MLHELQIKLDPPPDAADPAVLALFTLTCPALGPLSANGEIRAPLSVAERRELRWYLEDYWQWPYDEYLTRGLAAEQLMISAGKRLFQAVFGSPAAIPIYTAWSLDPRSGLCRQISLTIDAHSPAAALSLPWELLHDDRGFLALRTPPVALVRRLNEASLAGFSTSFTPPLRVLLLTSRPDDEGFIDPRSVAQQVFDALAPLAAQGQVLIEILRPPTLSALRERLSNGPPVQLLHFDGHGGFSGDGLLVFEDAEGAAVTVPAEDVAQVLQHSGVKLALLNACRSAQGSDDSALSGVAARLSAAGIDGVVAMSANVLVETAVRYVRAFYKQLAAGDPLALAHDKARQQLHADPRRHPHQRTLDAPGEAVQLRDWWLPQLYLQREVELRGQDRGYRGQDRGYRGQETGSVVLTTPQSPGLSGLPPEPRYAFGGRAFELLWLERRLLRGKLVLIHGFGGQGKTTLAAECARWLCRSGMYRSALLVSFEYGGGAGRVLAELGMHFGLDGSFRPDEPAAALAALRTLLAATPTLIIGDNLESILPGGEAALEADELTALWSLLLELRAAGAGVLLTSRNPELGDGRMRKGARVAHLALGGLTFDDAYGLATRILRDLEIATANAPYSLLKHLLERLDRHPLAIQLVLPALEQRQLVQIYNEFDALLKEFKDDGESGRNASLLASLEYSLRRLSDGQRALLPQLALFEGGASEDDLLAITQIPAADWAGLRSAMEGAALLRAEQVHEHWRFPFLRFHPILGPYLRGLAATADADLAQRYAERYRAVARYLYHQDDRNPLAVRALLPRELPNFRRAFELLAQAGTTDAAADLANSMARFYYVFGRYRERDLLLRAAAGLQLSGEGLSYAEYVGEVNQGEAELQRGALQAAAQRFTALLQKIEAQPAGSPRGPGSYEQCLTLAWLGRCYEAGGQPAAAEQFHRRALAVIAGLLKDAPDHRDYLRQRGTLQADLGDVLAAQGRFGEAKAAYEASLSDKQAIGDQRGVGVAEGQLGALALSQRNYSEARRRYQEALQLFQRLNEPASEATLWHQLGRVAEVQQDWDEAGRCYRRSLTIKERLGDSLGAARTCNQLANVAQLAGRMGEAEGWYRNALARPGLPPNARAAILNNLADLLLIQARSGRTELLAEARQAAEEALAILKQLDVSDVSWNNLFVLAGIAELEGRAEDARAYRRRVRETFAAFAGNRWHLQGHNDFVAAVVAAAQGDAAARAAIEEVLPQYEAKNWRISAAVQAIWAGERDWHALCEAQPDMSRNSALLIKLVLEGLA